MRAFSIIRWVLSWLATTVLSITTRVGHNKVRPFKSYSNHNDYNIFAHLDSLIYVNLCDNSGSSVSLSSDGRILAVGGHFDDSVRGATWIFVSDGSTYQQLGDKLVGTSSIGYSVYQGKILLLKHAISLIFSSCHNHNLSIIVGDNSGWSVSLSSDGRTLAVGGPYDDSDRGATWIFVFDGSTYQQLGDKRLPQGSSQLGTYRNRCICIYG